MITEKELNPKGYKLTQEQKDNVRVLLDRMNKVRTLYGKPMTVTSGVRSQEDQDRINPSAPKSKHLLGQAMDIHDPKGEVRAWVLANLPKMKEIGLWIEDFRHTKNWVHFQCSPPKSGKRIFVPSSAPAPHPDLWNGKYDASLDGF